MANFGELLRRMRQDASLTIEELAESSGLSVRGIGDLERGRRAVPQRSTVAALALGLGLDDAGRARLLAAARAARPAGGPSGDGRLPRGVEDFVGRRAELDRIHSLAASVGSGYCPVVAVSGPPGIGKSSLALQATRELGGTFHAGRTVVDLRGMDEEPPGPEKLLLRCLKAFGVPDRDLARSGPEDHPEMYREALAEQPRLLVLDNAVNEAQVRPLLPGVGQSMVIITSRRMLTGLDNVHRMPLGELTQAEAEAMLAGIVGPERAGAEAAAMARIAELCGSLPLALRVAGNWLATRTGWSAERYAERLSAQGRRLDSLVAGDVRVAAAFDLSYRPLSPRAARLFRLLALVYGPDTSAAGAGILTGLDLFDAEDALEELVETGLLGTVHDRYRLHDLLRLFAEGRLQGEETAADADTASTSLRHWLLETAVLAGRWYEPGHGAPATPPVLADLSDRDKARQWLKAEGDNWLGALRAAAVAGEHALVLETAEAMHWFSDGWAFWGHWTEVFRTAVASARAEGDRLAEATQLNYLAWAVTISDGRPDEGVKCAAQALEAAQEAGDLVQQGWSHTYSALALARLGEHSAAAEHNGLAADLFSRTGERQGAVAAMIGRGLALYAAHRHQEAVDSYQETLAVVEEAAETFEASFLLNFRANVRGLLSDVLIALERWDDAVEQLNLSAEDSRLNESTGLESRAFARLGRAHLGAGRVDEATAAYLAVTALGAAAEPDSLTEARTHLAQHGPTDGAGTDSEA
ncbi:helix-turn-helix domain-containing protein [Streptomyces sp. NPDC006654]|uniref:helix-turn-helix domain-containing protein n=1 Tax=Streptomyces sp. NPDC006654 TaxID=3156897 RepID=UPI0033F58DC2